MGSWISKAANVFRREEPRAPQPFELLCECGQEHTGIRRSRHQHIVCKTCGASLFVLPRDVYPPPHPVARRRRRPDEGPDAGTEVAGDPLSPLTEAGEIALSEPAAGAETKRPPRPSVRFEPKKPKKKSKSKRRRRREEEEEEEEDDYEIDLPREPGVFSRTFSAIGGWFVGVLRGIQTFFVEGFRGFVGFWTPLRLTLLGALLLISLMAAFSVRQHLREVSRRVVRDEVELANKALEKKDWIQARRHLDGIVAALDRLGRRDEEANGLRQLQRETTAMTRLCGISLFELLMTADDAVDKDGGEKWQQRFSSSYQGDWLVVEGPVVRITESVNGKKQRGYELEFPWRVGPQLRAVAIRADLPAFDALNVGEAPQFTVFAAPLKKCALSADKQRWAVELDGASGFLWVNDRTYEALGFTYDSFRSQDELEDVFAAQARVMEAGP